MGILNFKGALKGLPWWLSGKESTRQCRRRRFNPWSGKIPHATQQRSPWTTIIELVLQSLGATTEPEHARAHAPQQKRPL